MGEFGLFGQVALRTRRRERGTTGEDYVEGVLWAPTAVGQRGLKPESPLSLLPSSQTPLVEGNQPVHPIISEVTNESSVAQNRFPYL